MKQDSDAKYVPALGFRWLTPYYDAVVGATTRERVFKRALIRQAGVAPGQRVLDLACGTGTLAIWISETVAGAEISGVDGDPAMLALARRKAGRAAVPVRFDEAMSFALPYPDGYFDCIVSSLFFHHLCWQDKARTAQEIYRVLRPGGRLHVADWGKAGNIAMRALFLFVQLLDGFGNTQDNVSGRLPELFASAGFVDVVERKSFSTMFGTMALYSAARPG